MELQSELESIVTGRGYGKEAVRDTPIDLDVGEPNGGDLYGDSIFDMDAGRDPDARRDLRRLVVERDSFYFTVPVVQLIAEHGVGFRVDPDAVEGAFFVTPESQIVDDGRRAFQVVPAHEACPHKVEHAGREHPADVQQREPPVGGGGQ